jgi:Domain of unknown function (DUF4267)
LPFGNPELANVHAHPDWERACRGPNGYLVSGLGTRKLYVARPLLGGTFVHVQYNCRISSLFRQQHHLPKLCCYQDHTVFKACILPTEGANRQIYHSHIQQVVNMASPLHIASSVFAVIFVGFGINAILNPVHALTFFEFKPPASAADRKMVDSLMVVYGARDIFMGLAIGSAAYFGSRKALGWTVIAASGVAFVDGAVCFSHGIGHWNHWSYAPALTVVGSLLILSGGV